MALHQASRGNRHGARRMREGFLRYAEPYRPSWWGVDVDRLVADVEARLAESLDPAPPSGRHEAPLRFPWLA